MYMSHTSYSSLSDDWDGLSRDYSSSIHWCQMTFRIIKSRLLHEPDGIFFWWQYLMDYCINPFFSVVLVLWHNHLTFFVGLYLLCWKMARRRLSDAKLVLFSQITMDLCKNQPKICSFHIICVLVSSHLQFLSDRPVSAFQTPFVPYPLIWRSRCPKRDNA